MRMAAGVAMGTVSMTYIDASVMMQSGHRVWIFGIGPSGSGRNNVDSDEDTDAVREVDCECDDEECCSNVYIATTTAIVLTSQTNQRMIIMNERTRRRTTSQSVAEWSWRVAVSCGGDD